MGFTKFVTTVVICTLYTFLGVSVGYYSSEDSQQILGYTQAIGNGEVSSYAEFDQDGIPIRMGVVISGSALEGLPEYPSDEHNCADRNNDGQVDRPEECSAWYEMVLPLPREVSRNPEIPFNWILFNWNPAGHIPPGVWDKPHFDIHYYMVPIADIFSIEAGPCGPEFVDCDQFELGKKPLPDNYMHSDFKNVDAVAPSMGNHLVDPTGPEFHDEPFTHSWIYGIYDGKVIFYEQMIAREFLLSKTEEERAIKSPPEVGRSGYYPTVYTVNYNDETDEYYVSIEKFKYREASEAKYSPEN